VEKLELYYTAGKKAKSYSLLRNWFGNSSEVKHRVRP
jgi:hypothetical protein